MADRWARRCRFGHNSGRNSQSMFSSVGENLAYSSGKHYTNTASEITADIKLNFTFPPKTGQTEFNIVFVSFDFAHNCINTKVLNVYTYNAFQGHLNTYLYF